jgi:predicted esterase
MKNKTRLWISLCSLCSLCLCGSTSSAGEIERYDLGLRLIQLEKAWAEHTDAPGRGRALPVIKQAVPLLLAGKTTEAAAVLDGGRLLLEKAEPTAAERWANSLLVHPSARLLNPAMGPLVVHISAAYAAGDVPDNVVLKVNLLTADGATALAAQAMAVTALPATVVLSTDRLPEGDHKLRVEVIVGTKMLTTFSAGVSAVPNLSQRLHRPTSPFSAPSVDSETLRSINRLLTSLTNGTAETDYPAARLLKESEGLRRAIAAGQEYYGPQRTGQFWLTIPTGRPVRLFVPEAAKNGKPMPLVVALHGAGGSENLFFDAYGSGLIARLAQERGWMVVAPRAGWLFSAAPPAAAIVDELAKVYPVDKKRIFIVGHSMGAMQAVKLAQETSGRFAAIAALGGGGAVDQPDVFKDLPVFVGCGREDFLLGGAKGLDNVLKKAGATQLTYKEYPGVEHMLIVQEALPDVFKFFESAVRDASPKR